MDCCGGKAEPWHLLPMQVWHHTRIAARQGARNGPSNMTPTRGFIARLTRLVVAGGAVLALAACVEVPAPKLGPGPPPLVSRTKIRTLGPAPVRGEAVRFAFAAVTGVPADMRFSLEDSLKRYAVTRNLTIVPEGDPSAIYQVKGYLSAVGDNTGTLLVYTWDVADAFGAPLYRISGQETALGSNADPWVGITTKEIDDAARETIDKLADWANG
jgi:hypothetical protein